MSLASQQMFELIISFIIIDLEIFTFYFYQGTSSLLPLPKYLPFISVRDLTLLFLNPWHQIAWPSFHLYCWLLIHVKNIYGTYLQWAITVLGIRYPVAKKIDKIQSFSSISLGRGVSRTNNWFTTVNHKCDEFKA